MRKFLLNLVMVPAVGLFALSMISHCAADIPPGTAPSCSSNKCDNQCPESGQKCTNKCDHCDCIHRHGIKMCTDAAIDD